MTNARGHGARNGTLFEAPLDSLSVDRFTDEKPRDRHGEASLGVNGKNAEELHIMIADRKRGVTGTDTQDQRAVGLLFLGMTVAQPASVRRCIACTVSSAVVPPFRPFRFIEARKRATRGSVAFA